MASFISQGTEWRLNQKHKSIDRRDDLGIFSTHLRRIRIRLTGPTHRTGPLLSPARNQSRHHCSSGLEDLAGPEGDKDHFEPQNVRFLSKCDHAHDRELHHISVRLDGHLDFVLHKQQWPGYRKSHS